MVHLEDGRPSYRSADLRAIGRDVGIPAHRIEAAAQGLLLRAHQPPEQTFLGAPRSASHLVLLEGPLGDAGGAAVIAGSLLTLGLIGTVAGGSGGYDPMSRFVSGSLAVMGGGGLLWLRVSLADWARKRRAQMVSVGEVMLRLLPPSGRAR